MTSVDLNMELFVTFVALSFFTITVYAIDKKCDVNEFRDDCPAVCGTDFCPKTEKYSRSCEKPKNCPSPSCKCKFNFSRADNGTCISTRDCPPFPCTGPNEEYVSCPPYCPSDDCSQATPSGRCPNMGLILTVECTPTCRCKQGFWRHEGICVPYDKCPKLETPKRSQLSLLEILGL